MAKVNIPNFKLNTGREIPALGYGTWLGVNEKIEFNYADLDKMVDAMSYAIDVGYRHIDTAHLYRVEPEVGEVVNKKIKEGVVKREELFIATKVWHHNHREADVEKSVRDSLRRMNLDYLDLVLMHWPLSISEEGVDEKIDYLETWRGFETVFNKGLAKAIGVSNFNVEQMKRLLANCKVVPACNQAEINLTLGDNELVELCQANNIVVVAYSPFGSVVPSRAQPGKPEPRIDNPTLVSIAKKYNKTVLQICLRYLYQRGIVSIPKTNTKSRVIENASIFDFELDKSEFSKIAEFDVGYRTVPCAFYSGFSNYPHPNKNTTNMKIPSAFLKWKNGKNADID